MKNIIIVSLLLATSFSIFAQSDSSNIYKNKVKELGINSSNFTSIGVMYRSGHEKALWRVQLMNVSYEKNQLNNGDNGGTNYYQSQLFNVEAKIGREYRKNIKDIIELRIGADVGFQYFYQKNDRYIVNNREYSRYNYSPSMNLIFGVNHIISNRLVLGVEYVPSINLTVSNVYKSDYNEEGVFTDSKEYETRLDHKLSGMIFSLAYQFK